MIFILLYFYFLGLGLCLFGGMVDWYISLDQKSGHRTRLLRCLWGFIWPIGLPLLVFKFLKEFSIKLYNSIVYDKGV